MRTLSEGRAKGRVQSQLPVKIKISVAGVVRPNTCDESHRTAFKHGVYRVGSQTFVLIVRMQGPEIAMSRQRFALLHLSPILLLSLSVLCVPLTWAQTTLLGKQTSIQFSKYVVPLQTRLLPFHEEMPLSITPNLGQTEPGMRFISRGAGYDPLLPTNEPVVQLGAKANYSIANAPTRWIANAPNNVHQRTVCTRDLQYYGQRVPLVGQTILRIARQADSHPRVTRVLQLLINPQF